MAKQTHCGVQDSLALPGEECAWLNLVRKQTATASAFQLCGRWKAQARVHSSAHNSAAAGTDPGLQGKEEVKSPCTGFSPLPEPAQVAGISWGGDAASELIFHRPNSCDAYGGYQRSSTARANQMGRAAVA